MKIQFWGSLNADEVADELMLAFLARHRGGTVNADQLWKSLRSRGLTVSDGTPTGQNDPDLGAAIAEINSRLEKWLEEGLIGGEVEPEAITGARHFWVLGRPPSRG